MKKKDTKKVNPKSKNEEEEYDPSGMDSMSGGDNGAPMTSKDRAAYIAKELKKRNKSKQSY